MERKIAVKKGKQKNFKNSVWLIVFVNSHVISSIFCHVESEFSSSLIILEYSLNMPLKNRRDNREAQNTLLEK